LLLAAALFIAAVMLLKTMLSCSFSPAVAPVVVQEGGSMDANVNLKAGGSLLLPFPSNVVDGEQQVVMKKM
jgi:hypothetical protein